ncbi:hypothetical protein NS355_14265 [Sphingomonas yabuuchiae]|uniref:Uncharacterized protein n=1 Tax=Sphingomonas yabuuchiae TaxID=172044 RepID=A0A147IMK7_9SPHN|nr:hypothetical protein NS355_14265 [Sphingomonas yabuuchiae]
MDAVAGGQHREVAKRLNFRCLDVGEDMQMVMSDLSLTEFANESMISPTKAKNGRGLVCPWEDV